MGALAVKFKNYFDKRERSIEYSRITQSGLMLAKVADVRGRKRVFKPSEFEIHEIIETTKMGIKSVLNYFKDKEVESSIQDALSDLAALEIKSLYDVKIAGNTIFTIGSRYETSRRDNFLILNFGGTHVTISELLGIAVVVALVMSIIRIT
ncbi:hypothetical protein M2444_004952 [Paenibacillus sp. PastF-3]|uniref:hypothetical protein n=1 Tax=Paenibacillus sp. PastF-3 TaxID=2940626 RepID=UPI002473FC99|nr:hypothetical protein [Paenibacillus sp. PastF-3]MDH6373122.1 hypothetical protein [Paenibacillus sp. PastF-3]